MTTHGWTLRDEAGRLERLAALVDSDELAAAGGNRAMRRAAKRATRAQRRQQARDRST